MRFDWARQLARVWFSAAAPARPAGAGATAGKPGRKRWRRLGAGLAMLAAGFAPLHPLAVSAAPPPAEAFFAEADIDGLTLSPSGRWLAMQLMTPSGHYALAVMDTAQGVASARLLAAVRGASITSINWVGDDRILFSLRDPDRGGGERRFAPGLFVVNRETGEQRMLVRAVWDLVGEGRRPGDRALEMNHALLQVPRGSTREVIVGETIHTNTGEPAGLVPKLLDIETGLARSLAQGSPDWAMHWMFDEGGEPRLVMTRHQGRAGVLWRAPGAAEWKPIAEFDALRAPWAPHALDREGRLYVTLAQGVAGERVLRRFDFATGQPEPEALVRVQGFDYNGYVVSEYRSGRALGVRTVADAETTVWLDERMKALQAEIDRRLPGRINRLSCRRCDEPDRVVLVRSWSDRDPGQYLLWRDEGASLQPLSRANRRIDPAAMGTLDLYRIKARDGLELPVWVTRPAGAKPGQRTPAVLLAHGGPWMRGTSWQWRPMAQFLASRGVTVIEPEFRGSTGYGQRLFRAGWREWGRAMQDDLDDAVAWAVREGLVDGGRVCIAGGSYGGYAALMGLVREDSPYRCAAAWVAVSDPGLLFKWSSRGDMSEEARRFSLPAMIGDPAADAERLQAVSPVAQAARIRRPLMLTYGSADRRVPLEHGERMRSALRAAGQEPEYHVYTGEGHGWNKLETRVDFARRLEDFLARSLR